MSISDEVLAKEFFERVVDRNKKNDVFSNISDEQFDEIKKSFASETRKRNEKRYYRFECDLTEEIVWCVESKLGTYLKSNDFKKQLLALNAGKKGRANRNRHPEIYVHPEPAKSPFKTSVELENNFEQDPSGKAKQAPTIAVLGERPTRLRKLES
ncbi:hypothetical protein OPW07_24230 [Vibrio europaeus]|uniref:hypothetical protein n=1 Tax=Vibrio europaeus TaxID=300876 RepID=UPI0018A6D87B|nr:hypothetical protein [Vibrio europaeus]MDC5812832.1 hypothetical protein [Vibrio europaeus]QPG37626.1 hypothetical protein IXK98_15065 [Vibrio europaeus]